MKSALTAHHAHSQSENKKAATMRLPRICMFRCACVVFVLACVCANARLKGKKKAGHRGNLPLTTEKGM